MLLRRTLSKAVRRNSHGCRTGRERRSDDVFEILFRGTETGPHSGPAGGKGENALSDAHHGVGTESEGQIRRISDSEGQKRKKAGDFHCTQPGCGRLVPACDKSQKWVWGSERTDGGWKSGRALPVAFSRGSVAGRDCGSGVPGGSGVHLADSWRNALTDRSSAPVRRHDKNPLRR